MPTPGENPGWILKKQIANITDVLTIEICPEKYFFIKSDADSWSMEVYSYKVLMHAVDCWIMNLM